MPPGEATTCLEPSGFTRVMRPANISTTITEPSSIATGPSGNFRSLVISLKSMDASPGFIVWREASAENPRGRKVGTRVKFRCPSGKPRIS